MENVSNQFKTALSKEFKKSAANAITGKNPLPIESYGKMMTSLSSAQKEVKEDDYISWQGVNYNIRHIPSVGPRSLYSEFYAERGVAQ